MKCGAEARDVQKASLFHFISFKWANASSNLSIKAWGSESDEGSGVQKIPVSQAWPTAAFYLLNHSSVLGLLPIKLKPWLRMAGLLQCLPWSLGQHPCVSAH